MIKFVKYYIPALIWMGIIFYFSSIPGLRYSKSAVEEIILRKGAHFVEFSILFFLLWRVFFVGHKFKTKKAYLMTLILAIIFSATDEFHQALVPGRAGKIIDFIFDSTSIIFSAEIILILIYRKIKWKNVLVIFLSILILVGLEIKMIQDGRSEEKKSVGLILENEISKISQDLEHRVFSKKIKKIELNSDINDIDIKENEKEEESLIKSEEEIPEKIIIDVPFTTQAPFALWDEIHEEACEEASIIMLKYFFSGEDLSKEIAEQEIQDLVKFQNKKYGDFKDTTAQETVDLFLDFYGEIKGEKKLKVIYDFEAHDLKKYLARGFPIIIPAAGRDLGNPYFTPPGPLYHNLVLVGYYGDTIVTNDPGTRRGEGYEYTMDVLYSAIHDFPGIPENIKQGKKAMIVVE